MTKSSRFLVIASLAFGLTACSQAEFIRLLPTGISGGAAAPTTGNDLASCRSAYERGLAAVGASDALRNKYRSCVVANGGNQNMIDFGASEVAVFGEQIWYSTRARRSTCPEGSAVMRAGDQYCVGLKW